MAWWQLLLAACNLYLLLSLGPWIGLQILQAMLLRPGPFLDAEEKRLEDLREAVISHAEIWPERPRQGRYQQPDAMAYECLGRLRTAIREAERSWPRLEGFSAVRPPLVDILCLRCWSPLLKVIVVRREFRNLRSLLDQGADALVTLQEQAILAQSIPDRVKGLLTETQAEIRRLFALLEAEEEYGTQGLEEIAPQLEQAEEVLGHALDTLGNAPLEQAPTATREGDAVFSRVSSMVKEMDRTISRVSAARQKAHGIVERVSSGLRLAEERWEGLKARGATEPSIRRALMGLRDRALRLRKILQDHTLQSYEQIIKDVVAFDDELGALSSQLDALDEGIGRSREAIQGDIQDLGLAQARIDELVDQDPLLDLDQSKALLERAGETYMEAERQLGLGTSEGYQASLSLAVRAGTYLSQAMELTELLPERVGEIRELLESLDAETLGGWRSRIDRVREQLRIYSRHWEGGQAANVAEAVSRLDQVEIDLERIPPNIRYRRRFRQSEVAEALDILSHASGSIESAGELILALEEELDRIESMREDLEQALADMMERQLPSVQEVSQFMLPELQQRLQDWEADLTSSAEGFSKVEHVNYDEAMREWLPRTLRQLEEIREMHERDVQHYSRAAKEAVRQIDRQWARLIRLDPYQQPAPEEDAEALGSDLEEWRAEVERQTANPLALRDLIGHRVESLARRIERAQRQIDQGRNSISALAKQFQKQARSARSLRLSIQNIQNQANWPHLDWESGEAESAWTDAVRLERDSHIAPTLLEASNRLRRATSAARNAEQAYARMERQRRGALRRLDDELKAVNAALAREEREGERLREEEDLEGLAAVEEHCASVGRLVDMAQASTTFEDALRHLRDARDMLARF